jgi:hypothetical protein
VEESLEGGPEFGCEKEFGNLGFLAASCQVSKETRDEHCLDWPVELGNDRSLSDASHGGISI